MLKLKDRKSTIYSVFNVCLIEHCDKEAEKLWSTETNVIDVCEYHYKILQAESYTA